MRNLQLQNIWRNPKKKFFEGKKKLEKNVFRTRKDSRNEETDMLFTPSHLPFIPISISQKWAEPLPGPKIQKAQERVETIDLRVTIRFD